MLGSDPRGAFHKAPLAKDVKPSYLIRTVCPKLMGFETKLETKPHPHQVRTRVLEKNLRGSDPRGAFHKAPLVKDVKPS